MRFIDLFAGIGGFRRGMELAGHECVGFCEFDKFATASYTAMHLATSEQLEYLATLPMKDRQKEILKEEYRNGEWYAKDICEVTGDTIPRADCYCFGAPCQDFSVAGKMAGLGGDRSSLVREVFRIVGEIREEDRPEWLIYENVKGMFTSNRGFDFLAILLEMDELGYDCEWNLFNSKYHGVPQNRERVYLAGHLRSRGAAKIFPVKGTDGENSISVNILGHHKSYRRNTQIFDPSGITETLSTCQGGGREHYTILPIKVGSQNTVKGEMDTALAVLSSDYKGIAGRKQDNNAVAIPVSFSRGQISDEIKSAHCLSASGPAKEGMRTHQAMNRVVIPVITPDRAEKRQNGRRFNENGDEAFTLTAQDRHGVAISIEPEIIGLDVSYNNAKENNGISHCLNANDQRKVFGAKQIRTMVGGLIDGNPDDHTGIYVQLADDVIVYGIWYPKYECYIAIRRLTPRECFRLQGWSDEYFEKAALVSSDSQLYKQAGNGVTVNVVEVIGKSMT